MSFTAAKRMMLPSRFLSLPLNSKPLFPFCQTTLNSLTKPIKTASCAAISFQQKQNFSAPFCADSPLSGLETDVVGYVFGKKKATEVAHLVWKHVVRKGDTVVDATCGNGYDTLTMLKMVADESGRGRVYGLDIQGEALENTSSLLDETVNQEEKGLVKLFNICHSRMEEVVANNAPVRLVAFNLGYLPRGNKTVITVAETTLLALEAAERIVIQGGLVSIVVYVGHPGGREELETVEAFASRLSVDNWICCKFQMLNRPLAPVLVFLFKR